MWHGCGATPSIANGLVMRIVAHSAANNPGNRRTLGCYWPQTAEPVVQTKGTTTPVKQVV
jgi:hypothetical protein